MKACKRVLASALVIAMVLSFVGCHRKDETAVTIDGVKFTSAYYLCALVYADMEARQTVDESKKSDDTSSDTSSAEPTDYYSEKIEDTKYVDWVKEKAMSSLKLIAFYKNNCDKAKLKIDEDDAASAKQYASFYWSSYGYSQLFEPNGISEETYTQYTVDGYYSGEYFTYLYGKGGEKEIDSATVLEKTLENYILVDKIELTYNQETDDEKAAKKAAFDGYAAALTDGSKTFADIYKEYNTTEEEPKVTADDDGLEPVDKYATVIGSAETGNPAAYFDTVKAMAADAVQVIELENSTGLVLVVKKDLNADQYFIKQVDNSVRYIIEGDNFTKDTEKKADKLKAKTNSYAINRLKVNNIKYPETQAAS